MKLRTVKTLNYKLFGERTDTAMNTADLFESLSERLFEEETGIVQEGDRVEITVRIRRPVKKRRKK